MLTPIRYPVVLKHSYRAFGELFIGVLRFKQGVSFILKLWKTVEEAGLTRSKIMRRDVMGKILRNSTIGLHKVSLSKGFISKETIQNEIKQISNLKVDS